jgi:hypothetical protein
MMIAHIFEDPYAFQARTGLTLDGL